MTKKMYQVATFYDPADTLCKSKINAYTRDYNPQWLGCLVFIVDAETGKDAKRQAIECRLLFEKTTIKDEKTFEEYRAKFRKIENG
jgi:hypothetical protein